MTSLSRAVSFLGVAVLFAIMAVAVNLTFQSGARRRSQGQWVRHTLETISEIESARSAQYEVRDRERNLALGIAGSDRRSYGVAAEEASVTLETIRRLTVDNAVQQATLSTLAKVWTAYLHEGGRSAHGRLPSAAHQARFIRATELLRTMRTEEMGLLAKRQAIYKGMLDTSDGALVSSVMALSLLGVLSILFREGSARKAAEEAAERERTAYGLLEAANGRLADLAATDGLTGLANLRAFRARLDAEVGAATRLGRPLSLLFLDVDRFKEYNDAFGHPAGDRVLRTIGRLLQAQARVYDVAARHGGEEFVLLLPSTDAQEARMVAERIRRAIESEPWTLRSVAVSVGVASLRNLGTGEELMEDADRAMYAAKAGGRNRVCLSELTPLSSEWRCAAEERLY